MHQAKWNDTVIAESANTISLEGNIYFPPDSLRSEHLTASSNKSVCPWKGLASYYDVVVNGDVNHSAAWTYPDPSPAAVEIKNYVAFWNGVQVT